MMWLWNPGNPHIHGVVEVVDFWLRKHDIEYRICGCFARICFGSNELTNDLDILIPYSNWSDLADLVSNSNIFTLKSQSESRIKIGVQGEVELVVDFICDETNLDYGPPDSALNFKAFPVNKLLEHYFCLLDRYRMEGQKCLKFLVSIQQIIESCDLEHNFAEQLPRDFRVLFDILVTWKEEIYESTSDDDSVEEKYDQSSLLRDIQHHGAKIKI